MKKPVKLLNIDTQNTHAFESIKQLIGVLENDVYLQNYIIRNMTNTKNQIVAIVADGKYYTTSKNGDLVCYLNDNYILDNHLINKVDWSQNNINWLRDLLDGYKPSKIKQYKPYAEIVNHVYDIGDATLIKIDTINNISLCLQEQLSFDVHKFNLFYKCHKSKILDMLRADYIEHVFDFSHKARQRIEPLVQKYNNRILYISVDGFLMLGNVDIQLPYYYKITHECNNVWLYYQQLLLKEPDIDRYSKIVIDLPTKYKKDKELHELFLSNKLR